MEDLKIIPSVVLLLLFSLLMMTSMASAELINTPEGVIITHYPDKFDGVGTVYSLSDRGIVIDDMFIAFASNVRFMTPQSGYASPGSFKQGQKVGYTLNDKKQITKLCLFFNAETSRLKN